MEIVAEAGTAHGGNLDRAEALIEGAARAGADTLKFQAVFAEEILHPRVGGVTLHGQSRNLYEEFRRLERDLEFYARLKRLTESAGLRFLCSAFGIGSARMLRRLGVERIKIASPELNHLPLLEEVASYGLPLVLSSGVSRLCDLERALEVCPPERTTVLHCVTAYPAPPEDYRLHLLPHLSAVFGVPFGVSDHSLDPLVVPLVAVTAGAVMLEKHLTLSRADSGLDDPIALEPEDFRVLVRAVRAVEALPPEERRAAVIDRIGVDAWNRTLGSGPRILAPSERDNYGRTNRSICARVDLPAGTVLDWDVIGIYRVEKERRPGLSPFLLPVILGKALVRPVAAGDGIVWEDLLVQGEPRTTRPPGSTS